MVRLPKVERFTIATDLPVDLVIARLEAITKPTLSVPWKRLPLFGTIESARFVVRRGDGKRFRSPTSPQAIGEFTAQGDSGTSIGVTMQPLTPRPVQVLLLFILVGSVFNVLIGVVTQLRLVSEGDGVRSPLLIWIGFGILYTVLWGYSVLPLNDADERAQLVSRITNAIDGRVMPS